MREQKEQGKQNELLRVIAEKNHEQVIEYDVKEDHAVVYAVENDRFEVLFDVEDYIQKNRYGSVFIDPEDRKVFRRAVHTCLQKKEPSWWMCAIRAKTVHRNGIVVIW